MYRVRSPAPVHERRGDARHLHRRGFHYVSPNADLLALLFERLASESYSDLFVRQLFRPAEVGRCACVTVDRLEAARAAGGFASMEASGNASRTRWFRVV